MRILFLSPYVPYPPNFGGAMRIFQMIRQLSLRHEVHLVAYRETGGAGDPGGVAPYCRTMTLVPRDVSHKRRQQLTSLASPQSFQTRFLASRAMQEAVSRVAGEQRITLALVAFSQMASFRFPPGVPVVLDEHNVEFDLLERMAAREHGLARKGFNRIEAFKFKREELAAVRRSDLTLTTSARDMELLRGLAPHARLAVIPNGVDCDHFARPEGALTVPDTAVFVGATHYFPNEDGVRFFLNEIHARIRAQRPAFQFTAVGGNPPPSLTSLAGDGIAITGYVDDVRPHMWRAALFVVPLRMGGGTRFKIVEAMAAGVPVISTRLGAEGIPATDGRELLLADTPAAFADAVVRLLADPAQAAALARAGLAFVRSRYDWSIIGAQLEAVLATLPKQEEP
jgi:glycosyltransferase involved in cell wall biosynthesis